MKHVYHTLLLGLGRLVAVSVLLLVPLSIALGFQAIYDASPLLGYLAIGTFVTYVIGALGE